MIAVPAHRRQLSPGAEHSLQQRAGTRDWRAAPRGPAAVVSGRLSAPSPGRGAAAWSVHPRFDAYRVGDHARVVFGPFGVRSVSQRV